MDEQQQVGQTQGDQSVDASEVISILQERIGQLTYENAVLLSLLRKHGVQQ